MPSIFDTPAATPPASILKLRAFGDVAATRDALHENMLRAAQNIQPVSNPRYTLSLADVKYHGPERFSAAQEKQAILGNQTLQRRLQGTWILSDTASGKELQRRRSTIAHVPWMTDDGTFIHRGVDYALGHQTRLLPGVFTRRQNNGELESHVNVSKGLGHKLYLDPETGVFRVKFGQARIPLLPLLKSMGLGDTQLREVWGNELMAANMQHDDPQAMKKLYTKLLKYGKDTDDVSRQAAVVKAIAAMEIDPEVTKRTLGKPYKNLTPDAMLDITKKLLAVNRGESPEDDRDEQAYKRVLGPEDLLSEAVEKARAIGRKLLWKASAGGNLDRIGSGPYTDAVMSVITSSGLGQSIEEVNKAEILDHHSRVTQMGSGGITSMDAVPDSSRSVQPSQFGFVDFIRTPESGRVGVDARFAHGAMKGNDGRIYAKVLDVKTGEHVYKSPQDLRDEALAFPGELSKNSPVVAALVGGKVRRVPRAKVTYAIPVMEDTFSHLGNLVPAKSAVKGQRENMAARMLTQALPLLNAEAPLVQSGIPGEQDKSYEEDYGRHMGAVRYSGTGAGRVVSVSPAGLVVRDDATGKTQEIELHNNRPYNRKVLFHQEPTVKPGDAIQPGQLLAVSNFTDRQGVTALGKNARVAYIPWGGVAGASNFEDSILVSKSFAERMRSQHMYQHGVEWGDRMKKGLRNFVGIFPSAYDRKTLANFDDRGVIKPGTEIKFGSPLILVATERDRTKNALHRSRGPSFRNDSETWEHHDPGVVTDVLHTDKGVSVVVKTTAGLQTGDKLSARYGDKGVVSTIVDDEDMPHGEDGKPFEVLLAAVGISSRTNPAQIAEASLGKIAAKTGKPYKLQDFHEDDLNEFVLKELRKAGMTPRESITEPRTGRKVNDVFIGNRWFMKLAHTSESKNQGRGLGAYTADATPAKGGSQGAKRVGMLELNSLLSHGVPDVIRDAHLVRGQANPTYWTQYQSGFKPPTPGVPHVYHKFVNFLKGSGINAVRDGDRMHIMALTDKTLNGLTEGRELRNAETVHWKDMEPVKGGLFDITGSGGHGGSKWQQITLHKPLPSPVMEEPIRRVLGLTEDRFLDVLAGKEQLQGNTGPDAISKALQGLNLDREIERARMEIKSGKRTARDAAVRRLRYLKGAQSQGIHPKDWILSSVPVLPPAFRPVSTMGAKKLPLVADPNYLYKEMFDANQAWKDMSAEVDDAGDEQLTAYKAFKAVTGLGDPVQPKNQERRVKGMLAHVFGNSPKTGMLQSKLLGGATDLVGRAVVVPDPDLDMDQVGIPENRAWDIYKPLIVRHLVRRGMPRLQAARAIEARSSNARQALVAEMETRPVIVNRAPTLHRYGMMAFWPTLVKGDVLKTSPLIVKGFGMDYDGDAVQFHVPSTDEAAKEAAEKMLPSKNLFAVRDFKIHQTPLNEYQGGLYEASARVEQDKPPAVFATKADAIKAYKQGRINVGQQVHIVGD